MSDSISITVCYFASLREQRGLATEQLQVEAGLSLSQLWQRLARQHTLQQKTVLMTVNQVYVKAEQGLHPGDEVAFFPPVTGG